MRETRKSSAAAPKASLASRVSSMMCARRDYAITEPLVKPLQMGNTIVFVQWAIMDSLVSISTLVLESPVRMGEYVSMSLIRSLSANVLLVILRRTAPATIPALPLHARIEEHVGMLVNFMNAIVPLVTMDMIVRTTTLASMILVSLEECAILSMVNMFVTVNTDVMESIARG